MTYVIEPPSAPEPQVRAPARETTLSRGICVMIKGLRTLARFCYDLLTNPF